MPTALIIGASRGIGHELARQYLADGWRVIATARKATDCASLEQIGAHSHMLDVTAPDAIAALGWKLADEAIDVAVLNAGVFGPRNDGAPIGVEFDLVMHTNVLAAMRLLPILGPRVAAARGKLAVMSSRMGSLAARTSNSGTLYRASKAALNSVLLDASISFGPLGATCVALHPGWVRTEMGGASAELDIDVSANAIRTTLAQLGSAANGHFLNYDGTPIPW